jgi:hypothetical protein
MYDGRPRPTIQRQPWFRTDEGVHPASFETKPSWTDFTPPNGPSDQTRGTKRIHYGLFQPTELRSLMVVDLDASNQLVDRSTSNQPGRRRPPPLKQPWLLCDVVRRCDTAYRWPGTRIVCMRVTVASATSGLPSRVVTSHPLKPDESTTSISASEGPIARWGGPRPRACLASRWKTGIRARAAVDPGVNEYGCWNKFFPDPVPTNEDRQSGLKLTSGIRFVTYLP